MYINYMSKSISDLGLSFKGIVHCIERSFKQMVNLLTLGVNNDTEGRKVAFTITKNFE